MNFTHLCRSSNGVLVPTAGVVQAPGSIVVPSDLLDPNLPWVPNQLTYASHYRPPRRRRTLVPASMHTLDIEDEVGHIITKLENLFTALAYCIFIIIFSRIKWYKHSLA